MADTRWRTVALSEICSLRVDTIAPQDALELQYVGLEHIDSGQPNLRRRGRASEVRSAKNRFRCGDVLYGKLRPYLDKAVLAIGEGICSTDILVLNPNEQIESGFLVNLLHSRPFIEHAVKTTHGVNHPRTSWNGIGQFEFLLPPLSEQRAISRVLQTVQKGKETRQGELALERERKAALMEHLFTHGTRDEKAKETELGNIPESWKVCTLGALCEGDLGIIQTGPFGSQLHASDYVETGIPVINPTHLGFNSVETERVPRIPKDLADTLSKHYLLRGDILVSRRGDFGRFAYIGADESGWFCGTGCMLIRLTNPAVDNYFLALSMSLESTQTYLRNAAVGSIMPNLNTTILSQMPVLVPAIEEQRQIAEVLRACEIKIRALESEIPLTDELFAAMLAELMSGRIRTEPLSKAPNIQ
jgi:type I restriction enzyme, S subunit